MYVCICNAIKESELREAAQSHTGDVETLYESIGCAFSCGQCMEEAEDILACERSRKNLPAKVAA